jgi:hypothetical protein
MLQCQLSRHRLQQPAKNRMNSRLLTSVRFHIRFTEIASARAKPKSGMVWDSTLRGLPIANSPVGRRPSDTSQQKVNQFDPLHGLVVAQCPKVCVPARTSSTDQLTVVLSRSQSVQEPRIRPRTVIRTRVNFRGFQRDHLGRRNTANRRLCRVARCMP